MPLVSVHEISKVFLTRDTETRALGGVNFDVAAGEFIAITGPSGCGKSTLLSIMGLMDMPTRGSLYFEGRDTGKLSLTRRARLRNQSIGFVFQSFHLVGNLTALDNVALPLLYAGLGIKQRRKLATESLERVDMRHRAKHYPAELSGGQQQRVAIARALAAQPALILADEPTGNLDSENSAAVMRLLAEIHQRGTTVCLVTHDRQHASLAQRTIQLQDGQIVTKTVPV